MCVWGCVSCTRKVKPNNMYKFVSESEYKKEK